MLREQTPDLARIGLDRTAVDAGNAEIFERHALAVEHAEHIMIGRDEQLRGIGEGKVLGEPARVGMAMRR